MANTTTHIADAGFRASVASFFAAFGRGMVTYMERDEPAGAQRSLDMFTDIKIARLNALSDAQLAKLGITRDTIPAYVFRDLFYV